MKNKLFLGLVAGVACLLMIGTAQAAPVIEEAIAGTVTVTYNELQANITSSAVTDYLVDTASASELATYLAGDTITQVTISGSYSGYTKLSYPKESAPYTLYLTDGSNTLDVATEVYSLTGDIASWSYTFDNLNDIVALLSSDVSLYAQTYQDTTDTVFDGGWGALLVLDDVEIAITTAVPLPASVLFLGFGIVAMAGVRRRTQI